MCLDVFLVSEIQHHHALSPALELETHAEKPDEVRLPENSQTPMEDDLDGIAIENMSISSEDEEELQSQHEIPEDDSSSDVEMSLESPAVESLCEKEMAVENGVETEICSVGRQVVKEKSNPTE